MSVRYLRVVHQLLVQPTGGHETVEVLAVDADVELLLGSGGEVKGGMKG